MEIIESLKAELGQVNEKLSALEHIKNDRATLTAQANRLQKAIALLSGEPIVRKPMSPEAKERIRQGLEKARAAKAASSAQTPVTAQPVASTPEAGTGKKSPATEKGPTRAS